MLLNCLLVYNLYAHGISLRKQFKLANSFFQEPGQRSWYSDWLWAGQLGSQSSSPGRVKNFLFCTSSRPALGFTQPPIQQVPQALSAGVKWQGHEDDHSPPASAKVNKRWSYTSTHPYAFKA
jgi:hypothetical protein